MRVFLNSCEQHGPDGRGWMTEERGGCGRRGRVLDCRPCSGRAARAIELEVEIEAVKFRMRQVRLRAANRERGLVQRRRRGLFGFGGVKFER